MATLRNKRKLAALNKENCEEHPRSNLEQNSNVPRSQENYITQISEEIEGRVTKKLSQEFSRTENCILGALARLDHFLMNPLIQGHSGTAPETSRNTFSTNQGTNEDDSQGEPHPEAGIVHNHTTRNSGPEERHNIVTGGPEEIRNRHDRCRCWRWVIIDKLKHGQESLTFVSVFALDRENWFVQSFFAN